MVAVLFLLSILSVNSYIVIIESDNDSYGSSFGSLYAFILPSFCSYDLSMNEPVVQVVDLDVVMHCEGCAAAVKRAVKKIPGNLFINRHVFCWRCLSKVIIC